MRNIALIAKREITTRIATKSFVWSTLIMLVIIVAATFIPKIFDSLQSPTTVLAADPAAQQMLAALPEQQFRVEQVDDEAAARDRIESGDASAALVVRGAETPGSQDDGARPQLHAVLLTDGDVSMLDQQTLTQTVQTGVQTSLLTQAGIDLAQLQQQVAAAGPEIVSLSSHTTDPVTIIIAFTVSLLLFAQIFGAGMMVAQGVVEEKSSRVVEILLATVTPQQLLTGKVLGIGVVGLVQLVLFLVVGVAAATVNDLVQLDGGIIGIAATCVAWFIPGYLFYAFAYGAAGSMVSRQEEIGSTTTPLTVLVMGGYFASAMAMSDIGAAWVAPLSIVPPFSVLLMPMRIAAGRAESPEIAVAALLLLTLLLITALLGSRIYRRSVLTTGTTVKLRNVLR